MKKIIRVGIVGCGKNTRDKHVHLLQKIKGVELRKVCNRTEESSRKAAADFGIGRWTTDWRQVVEDPEIDAVVIGTWPDMHERITVAALNHGKHVLCEARMARDSREALNMLDAHRRNPHLVAQIVPAPFTLAFDETIQKLIAERFLGRLLTVEARYQFAHFLDPDKPMTFRENGAVSGCNTLVMGIIYESLARWIGHASAVIARGRTFSQFKEWEGRHLAVEIPEHLDIIADMHCGAQATLHFSTVAAFSEDHEEFWLHGSEGTIHLDLKRAVLRAGRRGDKEMSVVTPIKSPHSEWRVEEDFCAAIRGEGKVELTSFDEAYRYMEFSEAVIRSMRQGRLVQLPLNLDR